MYNKAGLMEIWLTRKTEITITSCMPISISNHPEVVENLGPRAEWFIETTGVEGFRLDAVTYRLFLMKNFIHNITKNMEKISTSLVNFWNGDTETNDEYFWKALTTCMT